jgi:hypothetical protein
MLRKKAERSQNGQAIYTGLASEGTFRPPRIDSRLTNPIGQQEVTPRLS